MTAVVWLRRSMRIEDNTALVRASRDHEEVIPFYVVDREYFSQADLGYPRVRFWHDSLEDLSENLEEQGNRLIVRKGKPVEKLEEVVKEADADSVYLNRDYSPYSRKRDSRVQEALEVPVNSFKDIVMFEKKEITTNTGDPYKVYSYYRDKWFERGKPRPRETGDFRTSELGSDRIPSLESLGFEQPEELEWIWDASRKGGKERLESFKERIGRYDESRDYPAEDATSKLSPHLKFGTVSVREAFRTAESVRDKTEPEGLETWQEELAWRDFYFQMLWNFPETVEEPFLEKYSGLDWNSKDEAPERWNRLVEGKTGYPFIDAGMRQLRREGWMHNRLRMAVTSFACKDLWLDWRDLHEYFSRMFVDAELSSMIGGIQWAYSIGTDAQPYFRVFNPWKQGKDYDPEGEFIREYVPELRDIPDDYIHRPHEMPEEVQQSSGCEIGEEYPEPVVDHDSRRKKAVDKFEQAAE